MQCVKVCLYSHWLVNIDKYFEENIIGSKIKVIFGRNVNFVMSNLVYTKVTMHPPIKGCMVLWFGTNENRKLTIKKKVKTRVYLGPPNGFVYKQIA